MRSKSDIPVLGYKVGDLGITELMLTDFKNSWDYYKFNLEERRDIVSRIYSFVGIPSFAFAILVLLLKLEIVEFTADATGFGAGYASFYMAVFLFLISIYGHLQIIALANETKVSQDYLAFLNNVRRHMGGISPNLKPFLKFRVFEKEIKAEIYRESSMSQHEEINADSDDHFTRKKIQRDPDNKSKITQAIFCITNGIEYMSDKLYAGMTKMSYKAGYWRSSSAIFVISSSFGLSVVTILQYFSPCRTLDVAYYLILFPAISIMLFFIETKLFHRIAYEADNK
tara:strand:- start:1755 stop:2606 length:852 start_codon:yes stop_codon:yes gene_type:complete